jgi:hypothetical protein
MKNKITNPFVTGGYIGPDYFCDRQNETDLLLRAISSKRNLTLISLRRMGKTGLLNSFTSIKYLQPITESLLCKSLNLQGKR